MDSIRARMFIDATYEGDLMALAGVSWTLGREANAQYGETVNGVQEPAESSRAGKLAINPYRNSNDPTSGLLPYLLQSGEIETIGSAAGEQVEGSDLFISSQRSCVVSYFSNIYALHRSDEIALP
ncbi:MAG: FAD-dependent oxidoreductase [Verrucomicrobiota bacterium]